MKKHRVFQVFISLFILCNIFLSLFHVHEPFEKTHSTNVCAQCLHSSEKLASTIGITLEININKCKNQRVNTVETEVYESVSLYFNRGSPKQC